MRFHITAKACILALCMLSLQGCKEEKAKAVPQKPAEIVFDAQKSQKLLSQRIAHVDIDTAPIEKSSAYIQVKLTQDGENKSPSAFLKDATSSSTKTIALLARVKNGEDVNLPSIPLYIFEKSATSWENTFQANGKLTPLFVAQRAPLDVSIDAVFLTDTLDKLETDATEILAAHSEAFTLYSKDRTHEISSLSDGFLRRIALVEEGTLKNIVDFSIPYLESRGVALNLLTAKAEIGLSLNLEVEGRTSVLPLHHGKPPQYNELLAHKIGTKSARDVLGDLESGFWSVPAEVLHPSCQAVYGALKERLGLSDQDASLIIYSMVQSHALFAHNIDYTQNCSGEDIAALILEAGLLLPPAKSERPSAKQFAKMNSTLTKIASILRNNRDDSDKKISDLMADQVMIRDKARFLFGAEEGQVIESATDVIAPSLGKQTAAEYLSSLPVKSYGCYAHGVGQVGHHRASLITMENDPSLWLIDFAFTDESKINGLHLRPATQRDFCRAIGGRKGANRCVFSGKNFPGLSADKCG